MCDVIQTRSTFVANIETQKWRSIIIQRLTNWLNDSRNKVFKTDTT